MAITVKHSKVSTIPDDADTSLVRPSDWNDDHVLTGTVPVANGGTGASTADGAVTNLLPSQTGNNGKFLSTDGTNTLWSTPAGSGDVVGPASATDNAITRFDGTTGKLIQNSVVTIGDTGAATGFTTLSASTSVTSPILKASNSAGGALQNASGTSQIQWGAGGGNNVTVDVSANLNGTNAQIDISPTGTGHVHIKPTGTGAVEIAPTNLGTMDNMTIGATTAAAGSFTNLSVTGTTSFDGAQGTAGQVLTSAGTGNTPTWTTPTVGDVVGPASATDNAVARFDSTTGKLIQNSTVTIDDSGQLNLTNASDYNLYASGAGANYMAGSLGIGTTTLTARNLGLTKAITGATTAYNFVNNGVIQSDVTTNAFYNWTNIITAAASFTTTTAVAYYANQGTIGAGSAITSSYGFLTASTLIGATNNYSFYGNIAAGTGRYNLYMAGTADNYMAGSLGIGAVPFAGTNLVVQKNSTGGTSTYSVYNQYAIQSDVTTSAAGFISYPSTAAASFTVAAIRHYYAAQNTFGAGSTVTTQVGFDVDSSLVGATSNYGFRSAIAAGTNRYNLYMNGTADNYLAGALGIGTTTLTGYSLRIAKAATGSVDSAGVLLSPQINSDVTSSFTSFQSQPTTQAASFTTTGVYHYLANNLTLGASSVVTNQYGFTAESTLTAATNDYGFRGNIAAATGRYNLYMNGTANNYLAGSLGIGTTSLTGVNLRVDKALTGATNSLSVASLTTIQSDVTSSAVIFDSKPSTAASAFTLTNLYHFAAEQGTIGATSAVTNQYGFIAQASLTGATNNYGFRGLIASGANRYNLYMDGTAANWFSGDVLVFGAGGLGYTTGSGGAVTQTTSRTTGVTLNKTNGAITLVSAAGLATYQSFTVTNSTVAATDTVIVVQKSGTDLYEILVTAVAAGSFRVTYRTTGGLTTEQPVFNFAVIKAVAA